MTIVDRTYISYCTGTYIKHKPKPTSPTPFSRPAFGAQFGLAPRALPRVHLLYTLETAIQRLPAGSATALQATWAAFPHDSVAVAKQAHLRPGFPWYSGDEDLLRNVVHEQRRDGRTVTEQRHSPRVHVDQ